MDNVNNNWSLTKHIIENKTIVRLACNDMYVLVITYYEGNISIRKVNSLEHYIMSLKLNNLGAAYVRDE